MNEILSYSSKNLIAVYNKITKTFLKPKKIQNPLTSNNVVCLSSEEKKNKSTKQKLGMGFQFSLLHCLFAEKESRKPIESGNTQVHKQQPKKPKKFLQLLSNQTE